MSRWAADQRRSRSKVRIGSNAKGLVLHPPDGSKTRSGGPSSGPSASVSAASVPETAGRSAASLIASAPSRVCPALVSVASPSVSAFGAPLTFAVIAMSSAARRGGGLVLRKDAKAAIDGMDAVKSPSALGLSPSASEPPNVSLANGESSPNTIGLGSPLAAVSGSLRAPATAIGVFRHTAERLKSQLIADR